MNDVNNKKSFKEFLVSKSGRFIMMVLGYVIVLSIIYAGIVNGAEAVFGIMVLLCGYFGWRSLNRITPNMFVIMSIGKWALYYLIKGLLSVCIGVFVAPYQISKIIVNKIQNV